MRLGGLIAACCIYTVHPIYLSATGICLACVFPLLFYKRYLYAGKLVVVADRYRYYKLCPIYLPDSDQRAPSTCRSLQHVNALQLGASLPRGRELGLLGLAVGAVQKVVHLDGIFSLHEQT